MALLNLIARLGLDNSGFNSSLKSAERTVNAFGNKVQNSIVGGLGKFFTLGFGLNTFFDKLNQIEHAFDRFDDTTRETAENVPMLFAPMMEELNAQQRRLNALNKVEEKKKELAKLEKELGDITDQNNLKAMSDEERRLELLQRYQKLTNQIREDFLAGKFNSAETLQRRIEAEKLKGIIQGIALPDAAKSVPEFTKRTIGAGSTDPLARIGGFTGGGDVKIVTFLERTAKATEETADNTAGNSVRFR